MAFSSLRINVLLFVLWEPQGQEFEAPNLNRGQPLRVITGSEHTPHILLGFATTELCPCIDITGKAGWGSWLRALSFESQTFVVRERQFSG